jgi:hypothetical protein
LTIWLSERFDRRLEGNDPASVCKPPRPLRVLTDIRADVN